MKFLSSCVLVIGALVMLGIMFSLFVICPPGPSAKEVRVRADFHSISEALNAYKTDAGQYPSTEQGLEALITRPEIPPLPRNWKMIADAIPRDPWQGVYRYRALPENDARGFEIISAGKDGQFGTKDDLSSLDPE